ncbi:hypothetical protein SUGI_1060320 [Cryptomeria japonica]|nr:hypothetical protein SUGI_1060320 [Cryptomeria japonica]
MDLFKAIGVSNYSEERLQKAHAQSQKRGIPLASNQVYYNLVYRTLEENGVKTSCNDLGITLIAYSPIGQGVLSGRHTPEDPPIGPRGQICNKNFLTKLKLPPPREGLWSM